MAKRLGGCLENILDTNYWNRLTVQTLVSIFKNDLALDKRNLSLVISHISWVACLSDQSCRLLLLQTTYWVSSTRASSPRGCARRPTRPRLPWTPPRERRVPRPHSTYSVTSEVRPRLHSHCIVTCIVHQSTAVYRRMSCVFPYYRCAVLTRLRHVCNHRGTLVDIMTGHCVQVIFAMVAAGRLITLQDP